MSLGDQIRVKRKALKLRVEELGELLGGIPAARIYKWEQDKATPQNEDRILINQWLNSEKVPELLEDPRPNFLEERRKNKTDINPYLVPFIDIPAQAGYRKAYSNIDYILTLKQYPILPDVDPTGAVWRYFQVDGDSMEPVLSKGDTVLTSQVHKEDWPDLKNHYTHVIVTHDELLIKDVYKKSASQWVLLSQNPDYEPRLLNVDTVRQLWVVRRHVKNRIPKSRMYNMDKILKELK